MLPPVSDRRVPQRHARAVDGAHGLVPYPTVRAALHNDPVEVEVAVAVEDDGVLARLARCAAPHGALGMLVDVDGKVPAFDGAINEPHPLAARAHEDATDLPLVPAPQFKSHVVQPDAA